MKLDSLKSEMTECVQWEYFPYRGFLFIYKKTENKSKVIKERETGLWANVLST